MVVKTAISTRIVMLFIWFSSRNCDISSERIYSSSRNRTIRNSYQAIWCESVCRWYVSVVVLRMCENRCRNYRNRVIRAGTGESHDFSDFSDDCASRCDPMQRRRWSTMRRRWSVTLSWETLTQCRFSLIIPFGESEIRYIITHEGYLRLGLG